MARRHPLHYPACKPSRRLTAPHVTRADWCTVDTRDTTADQEEDISVILAESYATHADLIEQGFSGHIHPDYLIFASSHLLAHNTELFLENETDTILTHAARFPAPSGEPASKLWIVAHLAPESEEEDERDTTDSSDWEMVEEPKPGPKPRGHTVLLRQLKPIGRNGRQYSGISPYFVCGDERKAASPAGIIHVTGESYKGMELPQRVKLYSLTSVNDPWAGPDFPQDYSYRTYTRWVKATDGTTSPTSQSYEPMNADDAAPPQFHGSQPLPRGRIRECTAPIRLREETGSCNSLDLMRVCYRSGLGSYGPRLSSFGPVQSPQKGSNKTCSLWVKATDGATSLTALLRADGRQR